MTHEQANRVLDHIRAGATYPSRIVDFALFLTGDYDAYEETRGQGMAAAVSAEDARRWGYASPCLVGGNHRPD